MGWMVLTAVVTAIVVAAIIRYDRYRDHRDGFDKPEGL